MLGQLSGGGGLVWRKGLLGGVRRRVFADSRHKVFTIAAGTLFMALLSFTLTSLIGRGARMEALLHRYVDRLGWAAIALVVVGALLYQF